MPSNIASPTPSAAVDRLALATDNVRGTEGAAFWPDGHFAGQCFAGDAE